MEFTVSKADLVRELNLSQGVVEKKTTIPILSNILLEAKGGRVILTATDLELGIRCSCAAKVKKEGAGTVPAKKLLDFVRLLPEMPEATNQIPVAVLSSMIAKTIFAISMEESRFTLNGALLLIRPEGVVMVSTDGHRLAYVENVGQTADENRPFRALVPRKAMSEILKLSQEG